MRTSFLSITASLALLIRNLFATRINSSSPRCTGNTFHAQSQPQPRHPPCNCTPETARREAGRPCPRCRKRAVFTFKRCRLGSALTLYHSSSQGTPDWGGQGFPAPNGNRLFYAALPRPHLSVGRTQGSKESLGSIASSCRCTDASRAIDSAAVASICYSRTLQGTPHPITPPEVEFTIYQILLAYKPPSTNNPIPGATHPPTHRPRLGRGRPLS